MPRRERAPGTALLVAVGTAVGLAVGAVVAGTATREAAPSPAGPSEVSRPPPATSCIRAAELAEQIVDLAEEASGALAALDARTLEELLDEMRERDARLQQEVRRCRAVEAGRAEPTAAVPEG